MCAVVTCALEVACRRADPPGGPELQVLGESARLRIGDALPLSSPYFDGARVALLAARGETLGVQVWHPGGEPVRLSIPGETVVAYAVDPYRVVRPSSDLYGGSQGAGMYPDGLREDPAPTSDPAYFEITTVSSASGELVVGERHIPIDLAVTTVELPPLPLSVWAYYDARELGGTNQRPSAGERACIELFRAHGVLLSPDLPQDAWPARRELLDHARYVPARIPDDPVAAAAAVRGWIERTQPTGPIPFAVPIDEPHTLAARARVRVLGEAAHAAGGGAGRFLLAVTDEHHPEYGDAVDVYFNLRAQLGDWTYNGAPPQAGAMVLDAEAPGLRTWGWIAWRYQIPLWYAWDALYWHDRHNHHGALDAARDATSFDSDDDHGNLDGVLAMPGCQPTLRLAALRRGLEDGALLDLAARCDRAAADAVARRIVPRALGEAGDTRSWPADEAPWEAARRELIAIAASCR
jgi:hypothetical protein